MPASTEPAPRVVVIDNYDSFTHNIVHALELASARCTVVANDWADAAELVAMAPDGFLVSAGPCTPRDAGVTLDLVKAALHGAARGTPLLGICLGHQAIAQALGAVLRRARRPLHGKTTRVRHDGRGLFVDLPQPLEAMRYNSLTIEPASLAAELEACAWDDDGELMALRHRELPIAGVQFHPESAASRGCERLFATWVASLAARRLARPPRVGQAAPS
jgi:anthranilate synthase/aminodeoxychorismate synthase-like glutamine amidotransferase